MSRFLFVVPPFAGHINPAAGVAAELAARGHAVSWVADAEVLTGLVPDDAKIRHVRLPGAVARPAPQRGFDALRFLWERVLVPLAAEMVPAVEDAVAVDQPDVVVADQQAFAGALVAERFRLPWATSATTSSEFTDPLAAMPKVRDWVAAWLTELRVRYGDPDKTGDLRYSPHLVLGFTTADLLGDTASIGATTRLVGPVTRSEPDSQLPFDIARPLVYVSLGTVNAAAGERFLHECVAALAERPWLRAVVADQGGVIADAPENVVVRESVPQLAVLDHADAVLCHAGHNTVCESLARGVPLVVAPIRDDQPIVAEQVVRSGAGLRLRFARATSSHIGAAIDTVLSEDTYRVAARRIARSFRAAGGAVAAADHLVALAVNPAGPARPDTR
ncbi:glycosyltransferase [Haloechinothrix halophila]|uniref:glycosyltransferase n=1 Tax=Haloechinothrix halophila TaxID=1069073 RepID=UPI0003FBB0C7|nr:glycosyltransferase [Haloechinothrix halophila]